MVVFSLFKMERRLNRSVHINSRRTLINMYVPIYSTSTYFPVVSWILYYNPRPQRRNKIVRELDSRGAGSLGPTRALRSYLGRFAFYSRRLI